MNTTEISAARAAYHEWLATRPEIVRRIGETLDPWRFYVMRHDNIPPATDSYAFAVYRMEAISEDGTVRVAKYERILGGAAIMSVFGVSPDQLRALPVDFDIEMWATDWTYDHGKVGDGNE